MAKDMASISEFAPRSDLEAERLRLLLETAFQRASGAAVAAHLTAGRSVSGVLHGVPVTIVPDNGPDRA